MDVPAGIVGNDPVVIKLYGAAVLTRCNALVPASAGGVPGADIIDKVGVPVLMLHICVQLDTPLTQHKLELSPNVSEKVVAADTFVLKPKNKTLAQNKNINPKYFFGFEF
jgi:hypothetical protein